MWCRAAPQSDTGNSRAAEKMENAMLGNAIVRLVREDAGMEMVEWSIVGVVFALAGALLWSTLKTAINSGLTSIGDCVGNSSKC